MKIPPSSAALSLSIFLCSANASPAYEDPSPLTAEYSKIEISNSDHELTFGVVLFSEPLQCKGQIRVKFDSPGRIQHKVIYARKGSPFTLSAIYFTNWKLGFINERNECHIGITFVPQSDAYLFEYTINNDAKECHVKTLQVDKEAVTPIESERIAFRKRKSTFFSDGTLCEPLDPQVVEKINMK